MRNIVDRPPEGVSGDAVTSSEDFEAFDTLPPELRAILRDAPINISSRKLQAQLDAGFPVERVAYENTKRINALRAQLGIEPSDQPFRRIRSAG